MKKRLLRLFLALSMIVSYTSINAQTKYIHCGNLIDVEKGKVNEKMTILVEGEKIKSIEKGFIQVPLLVYKNNIFKYINAPKIEFYV